MRFRLILPQLLALVLCQVQEVCLGLVSCRPFAQLNPIISAAGGDVRIQKEEANPIERGVGTQGEIHRHGGRDHWFCRNDTLRSLE